MKKAQQEARPTLTAARDRGDGLTVTFQYEGGQGPTDALFAEIAFILADSQRAETTASTR